MSKLPRLAVVLVSLLAALAAFTADAQVKQNSPPKKTKKKFGEDTKFGEQPKTKPGAKTKFGEKDKSGQEKESPKKGASRKRKPTGPELSLLEHALVEHALSADEVDGLIGKQANLLLNGGKRVEGAKLVKFVKAKDPARIKSLNTDNTDGEETKAKSRGRSFSCKTVFSIEVDKHTYEVRFVASQKAYALIDIERHKNAVKTQLEASGYKLWEPLSTEKLDQYVEEEKKFLDEVKQHFSQLPLQLHESKYFLFLTDIPHGQIAPYVTQLDAMSEKLGEAFGFAPGENIWRGKEVIVAFVDRENFTEFESTFKKVQAPENVLAICHPEENGRAIVAAVRGDDPVDFGAVLVHETAHGYMHRYQSNKPIPKWLNEGIADWIAGVAVPNSRLIKNHQESALEQVQTSGTLGGLFQSPMPEAWQYGVGSAMVELLIRQDPEAFRLFFDGIKDGLLWEDSLQRAYGASREDLIQLYANAVGVEGLEP